MPHSLNKIQKGDTKNEYTRLSTVTNLAPTHEPLSWRLRCKCGSETRALRRKYRIAGGLILMKITQDKLRALFEVFGIIQSITILLDNQTKLPRGFAFVTFSQLADADNAKNKMNHAMVEGRELKVYFKRKATE